MNVVVQRELLQILRGRLIEAKVRLEPRQTWLGGAAPDTVAAVDSAVAALDEAARLATRDIRRPYTPPPAHR